MIITTIIHQAINYVYLLHPVMNWNLIRRVEDFEEPSDNSIVVIIDVLRFSTTAITLLEHGARYVRPFVSENNALEFKQSNLGAVLVGESNGIKLDEFDLNNSPTEIQDDAVRGKPVGILTTNGTRSIREVQEYQTGGKNIEIWIGAIINAKSVVQSIEKTDKDAYLLAAGKDGNETDDDIVGAELIRDYGINNEIPENRFEDYKQRVRNSRSAENLRNIGYEEDVEYCLDFNSSSTIPKLENQTLVNNG